MNVLRDFPRWVYEYGHLDNWLGEATKGLSKPSCERVKSEISEHFEQSIAELNDEGCVGMASELEAISRLGHPRTANKKYKKVFLTIQDEQVLSGIHKKRKYLGIPLTFFLVFFLVTWNINHFSSTYYALILFYFLTEYIVVPVVSRFSWKHAVLCDEFTTCYIGFAAFYIWSGSLWVSALVGLCYFFLMVFSDTQYFLRKLNTTYPSAKNGSV